MASYPQYQYWDTSLLFPETQKVCALCDRGFPVKTYVKVESVDGKPVKDAHVSLSQATTQQINKAFGVIDTGIVTIS